MALKSYRRGAERSTLLNALVCARCGKQMATRCYLVARLNREWKPLHLSCTVGMLDPSKPLEGRLKWHCGPVY